MRETETRRLKVFEKVWITEFYKSCLYDKLITLALTAPHSEGSKGAELQGDGP